MSMSYFFRCNIIPCIIGYITHSAHYLLENLSFFEAYFNINLKPISDCLNIDYWDGEYIDIYFDAYKTDKKLDIFWEHIYQQTYRYHNDINSIKTCLIEFIAKIKAEKNYIELTAIINNILKPDTTKRSVFRLCYHCPSIEDSEVCLNEQKCQYPFSNFDCDIYDIHYFLHELEGVIAFVIKAQENNATLIYCNLT
jgi:hypothetical protein